MKIIIWNEKNQTKKQQMKKISHKQFNMPLILIFQLIKVYF